MTRGTGETENWGDGDAKKGENEIECKDKKL